MKQSFYLLMISLLWIACQPTKSSTAEAEVEAPVEEVVAEKMSYPADSLSPDGMLSFHGLRINDTDAMPVADLQAAVSETGSMDVKISGEVQAACQAKGCWMTLPLADGSNMRVKFKDYGFFVPKDSP
ncbi:MAG: DUF4920 domain-containing protein, partial [Bacteroidota bacterium]